MLRRYLKIISRHVAGWSPAALAAADNLAQWRDEGARLHGTGRCDEAANIYGKYLALKPADFTVWLDRGDCLTDIGAFDRAIIAYEEAALLKPNDAGVYRRIGDMKKILGWPRTALEYYRRSFRLDPTSQYVLRQLSEPTERRSSRSPLDEPRFAGRPAVMLDISDLLQFLTYHRHVTGIQRVQMALLVEALDPTSEETAAAAEHMVFCWRHSEEQTLCAIARSDLRELLETFSSRLESRRPFHEVLKRIYGRWIEVRPRPGDVFVVVGAFWVSKNYGITLRLLKRNAVRIAVLIHDLIPFTHPQYVHPATREEVVKQFDGVMSVMDFVLTTTQFVAGQVRTTLQARLGRSVPMFLAPLAHTLPAKTGEVRDEPGGAFRARLPAEYVLCVGTLEARKNHLALLETWIALDRKHAGRIPALVLVGKWGWMVDGLRERLEATGYVNGRVIVFNALSDVEMEHAYRNCLFTVFPSFVEGWGLPVGESLASGKPCITSGVSSLPEVGGEFCRYIDPHDRSSLFEAIESTLLDRKGLAEWAAMIQRDFKARTWPEMAQIFMGRVIQASHQAE